LVVDQLEQAGFAVAVFDNRFEDVDGTFLPAPSFSPPQVSQLVRFGVPDRPLLDFVQSNDRAVIHYQRGKVDPAKLIAQIALAWPHRKIAVAVTRIAEARQLRDQLTAYLPNTVALSSRNFAADVGQVVVGTYTGLGDMVARMEWIDVVIAVDAREAISRRGLKCIMQAWRARTFGLVANDVKLAPSEQDRVADTFGFGELMIPAHGHHQRLVEVVYRTVAGGPELPGELKVLELKRQGIWNHPVRNRQVAKATKAALAGEGHQLAVFNRRVEDEGHQRVVVLVEGIEHALRLAQLLPTWSVVAGEHVDPKGLRPEDLFRLRRGRSALDNPLAGIIVTSVGMKALKLSDIDVVVRADGGVGLPALPREELVEDNAMPSRPLRIVDFVDRHHRELERWSWQRRKAYEDSGWGELGADPVAARMQRFLRSRPKRKQS
jgi:hypothetical protein